MSLPTLGIDGAIRAGAEVLLDPKGRAIAAVVWETKGPKGSTHLEVRSADQSGIKDLYRPVGNLQLANCCHNMLRGYVVGPLQMAMEDVFIGKNPSGSADLLKIDGLLASPWHRQAGEQQWVPQQSWRKNQFPRSWKKMYKHEGDRSGTPAAKRCSLHVMPTLVPGLAKLLDALGKIDHITDAAGVARWLHTKSHGR